MEWYENSEVWESLDDLILNMWPAVDRLFSELLNHQDEFQLHTRALLFGGIGQFCASYVEARNSGKSEIESYELSAGDVLTNPTMQKMLQSLMNNMVDGVVANMEELQ
jgi:hypothetical protein|tara:strand:+ start:404 stop:727 length:324 start_codon:yes stop_codon:yes gene_type:complete